MRRRSGARSAGAGGLLTALAVAALATAPAGDARAEGPMVLFVGASGEAQAEEARGLVTRRLGYTAEELSRSEPLVEYVFGGADLWPTGGSAALCPADTDRMDLAEVSQRAADAIDLLEFGAAIETLEPVFARLGCVEGPVDAGTLSRAAMLLGYARYQANDREGAEAAFGRAAVFDPDVKWDEAYPPGAQQVFNAAVLDSLRAEDAHLWPAFGAAEEAMDIGLDGGQVPADGLLRPGLHQMTVKRRDGGVLALAVQFLPGETVRVEPVRELIDGFFAGAEESEDAGAALVAALDHAGYSEALIVEPAFGRIYRFHAGTGEVREIPGAGGDAFAGDTGGGASSGGTTGGGAGAGPPKKRAAGGANPGPVMVIGGGVALGVGLAVGLSRRSAAIDARQDYIDAANEGAKNAAAARYEQASRGAYVGYAIAGVGAAVAAVGVPLWATHGKRSGDSTGWLLLQGAPGVGGAVTLAGRW